MQIISVLQALSLLLLLEKQVLLRVGQQCRFNMRRDGTLSYSKSCGFPPAEQRQMQKKLHIPLLACSRFIGFCLFLP